MTNCLRASVVNCSIFEKMGNRGYRRLIHRLLRPGDILRFMKGWYGRRCIRGPFFPWQGDSLKKEEFLIFRPPALR